MSLWRWLGTPMFARHCPILFQDGFHRPDQNPWTGDDNWDVLSGTWKIDNHRLQLVTPGASHSIVKCLRPIARPFVLIVPIKDNSGYVCVNFEDPSNYNYVRWWWSSSTSLYTSVGEVVGGTATGFSSSVDGSCSGNETRETELYVCVTEHGVSASAVCVPQAWRLKQGVLTTRTSDTEGVITLGSSHGFSNDYVDVQVDRWVANPGIWFNQLHDDHDLRRHGRQPARGGHRGDRGDVQILLQAVVQADGRRAVLPAQLGLGLFCALQQHLPALPLDQCREARDDRDSRSARCVR